MFLWHKKGGIAPPSWTLVHVIELSHLNSLILIFYRNKAPFIKLTLYLY